MFQSLIIIAAGLFLAHVILLLAAFRRSGFSQQRYFYSHLTLWLTGICVFALAFLFGGKGQSSFLDYFNTSTRLFLILGFTAALSLTAHLIVKYVVLRLTRKPSSN